MTPAYLAEAASPAAYSFPATPAERLRCRVFADLWRRGYFLTTGGKFGAHFLVYPGQCGSGDVTASSHKTTDTTPQNNSMGIVLLHKSKSFASLPSQ